MQNKESSTHKSLIVYKRAYELSLLIYKNTVDFPKSELFGLTSQMRRCAVSVAANIVEGYARRTPQDKLQFYYIARGSLTELEYYIDLASDLSYYSLAVHETLKEAREEVGKLLNGFMRSIK